MLPPAPARLSTTTGTPRLSVSFFAMRRAAVSVAPPAANPTTSVIVFFGNSCAPTVPSEATIARTAAQTSFVMFTSASIVTQPQRVRLAAFDGPLQERRGTIGAVRKLAIGQGQEQRHHDSQVHAKQQGQRIRSAREHQQQPRAGSEKKQRDKAAVHRLLRGIAMHWMACQV